ncbi:MAG: CBS domain-containing protein [Candidatus Binatota bacterium]|nr:CBS domain-containing protein [Candidatus Binatota bacterium]
MPRIDHKSTATLTHERPVIVYSNDFLCDLSPRAAWRLESLGFDNVCDYVAGKEDWLAYGLPIEGELAEAVTVGKLADREVPVCRFDDKLADLVQRLRPTGWSECVVVNEPGIVLGLLRKSMWEHPADDRTAEQVMESGPITFRPSVRRDEMVSYLQEKQMQSALVTTSDGKLVGLLRRKDLEEDR